MARELSEMTHYQMVCEFNKAFDYTIYDIHNGNPLVLYPKESKYRYDLIYEEGIVELGRAIRTNNLIEMKDAIADLLYVLYGACYTFNFNPDIILETLVQYSLLSSKFFNNTNNIYKDIEHYIENIRIAIVDKKDITLLYGNIISLIWIVYYFSEVNKIDIDNIFLAVHLSNMSKLCKTEDEAIETVNKYNMKYENHSKYYELYCNKYGNDSELALSVYSPYDSPYYYKSGNYWLVKNKSTGKALKSINYKPVDLT